MALSVIVLFRQKPFIEICWVQILGVIASAKLPLAPHEGIDIPIFDELNEFAILPIGLSRDSSLVCDDAEPMESTVVVIYLGNDPRLSFKLDAVSFMLYFV